MRIPFLLVAVACAAVGCVPPGAGVPEEAACTPGAPYAAMEDGPALAPLDPSEAGTEAVAAFSATDERDADGGVPLVVVAEDAAGRPEPVTVSVGSAVQAEAVAGFAAALTDVVAVDVAQEVRVEQASDPMRSQQWALDRVDYESVWPRSTGTGVTVAVVDTGVDRSHADLGGRVLPGRAFLDLDPTGRPDGGVDPNGHGTHVAGIIAANRDDGVGTAGAAPGASVLPVRAIGASGSGWDTDIARGIVWAVEHGADVVNLSLGGSRRSQPMRAAIQYAVRAGAVVVAAAGNGGQQGNPPSWPGAEPAAVAVAAVDADLRRAAFSTAGSYVDLAAPGVAVLAPYEGDWARLSGTSMAAPHVSAAAALVAAAHPAWTSAQVRGAIERTARDLGAPGTDVEVGRGLVDPRAAVGC